MANNLELAYMMACKHTEVAGKVLQTAHGARTEHLMALGMMQKLKVTSKHIIDTLIPYIKLGVEKKDPKLVLKTITMATKYITDMEKKSSETVQSYNEFQKKIIEMQMYLNGKVEDIGEETRKLQRAIAMQKQLLAEAIAYKEEKEKEKNELTKEMEDMKIEHERSMKRAEEDYNKGISWAKNPNWIDGIIGGGALAATFILGPGALLVGAGYGTLRGIISPMVVNASINTKNEHLRQLQAQTAEQQNKLRSEITEANKSILDCRYNTLELEAKSSDLADKKAALVDARQIQDTAKYAIRLGGQFTAMQLFWQKMSESHHAMEMRIKANELLLDDAEYGLLILASCEQALTDWNIILDICTKYEQTSALELKENYKFVAVQFDTMPEDVKGKRKEALISSITSADEDLN
ncbi:hypothetical protein DPMN_160340 [Dreissena polymorpha]|uniref:Uncharacterized protein n=2 Tax=Dreissena polymorpha TaxID=45954 RepID=A0A9D4EM31_DREPO|nr:hypothetical protein DPMN_160340 [Dreissena polymorpha]